MNYIKHLILLISLMVILASCTENPFTDRETVPLTDYGYEGESMLVETTMKEVDELIENKETFALFFGFAGCPYCKSVIGDINDTCAKEGIKIGYIDTRKDPSWDENTDIDDYDLVVKHFSEYLEGSSDLYVPELIFIKNGKVVCETPICAREDVEEGLSKIK